MTFKGINFRQSATHPSATDSADDTYWHFAGNETAFSAVRGAFTGGFGRDAAQGSIDVAADRSGSGVDARLAGLVHSEGSGSFGFKVKLPNGAGQYNLRAAFGDRLAARPGSSLTVRDGSLAATVLHSMSGSTTAADKFLDINGTEHTAANWPSNNTTVTVTFTTDTAYLQFGADNYFNHIAFEPVGGGGGSGVVPFNPPMKHGAMSGAFQG